MKVIVGFLSLVGLVVVGVFVAAIGLFALDEIRRKKAAGDDFAPVVPPAAPESGNSTDKEETVQT